MPFPRRGRRRPPFLTSRWQRRTLESLRLYLAAPVRATLTAWMKIYGETNDLPGLVTGPIELRFRRLCEHAGADTFLLWTTPDRWSAGEGLSLWIPAIGLDLECRFDDGRLHIEKAKPTTADDRDPRKQKSAVGMELHPALVELPSDATEEVVGPSLEVPFERLLGRRFHGFVGPLREALEAEARDDDARAERLATTYQLANPRIGGPSESDPYRLAGIDSGAVGQFDEGEWLDLVDGRGRVTSSARLVRIDPAEGVMDVDVRGAEPPAPGTVRPRPQTQILAQKRAILDELDNPTGGLRDAVRLVASPASLPIPRRVRPIPFVNKLVMQNRSQSRAVSLALGLDDGQALMVQGPPGTGKSTTLAEILGQLVLRDPTITVLVCSHSNHGVDNLLLKTLPYLESVPELQIARVGLFDRVHPLARKHFVPPGEDLDAYNVVFTTVDALALQSEAGARQYDYAVLDEANRASILDSLIPLVRGRRFILVGDHLQLQPVLSEAEEQLRLEPAAGNNSAIGKSLFAWLRERRFPEGACVFLDEQNRMHPVIAGLISEVFYEGKLRSGRRAPRRPAQIPLFNTPVIWVDTRGLHGLREARGRGASLMNVPEARLVATIARHMLATGQPNVDVGVIAAYAEQTALLRRLLARTNRPEPRGKNGQGKPGQQRPGQEPPARGDGEAAGPGSVPLAGAAAGPNGDAQHSLGQHSLGQHGRAQNGATAQARVDRAAAARQLEIDTVDAFEGREKDVIIVSLVRSNRRRDIGFLRLMQRINVALSRARTMLVIVGDTSTLRGSYFDRIVRYVRANGSLVPGPRLIGRLLNARTVERAPTVTPRRRARPLPRPVVPSFPDQEVPPGVPTGRPAPGRPIGAPADSSEDAASRRKRRRRRVRGRAPDDRRGPRPNELAPNEAAAGGTRRPPFERRRPRDAAPPGPFVPGAIISGPGMGGSGPSVGGPSSSMGGPGPNVPGGDMSSGAIPGEAAPGIAAASSGAAPIELGVVRQAPTPFSPLTEPTPQSSASPSAPVPMAEAAPTRPRRTRRLATVPPTGVTPCSDDVATLGATSPRAAPSEAAPSETAPSEAVPPEAVPPEVAQSGTAPFEATRAAPPLRPAPSEIARPAAPIDGALVPPDAASRQESTEAPADARVESAESKPERRPTRARASRIVRAPVAAPESPAPAADLPTPPAGSSTDIGGSAAGAATLDDTPTRPRRTRRQATDTPSAANDEASDVALALAAASASPAPAPSANLVPPPSDAETAEVPRRRSRRVVVAPDPEAARPTASSAVASSATAPSTAALSVAASSQLAPPSAAPETAGPPSVLAPEGIADTGATPRRRTRRVADAAPSTSELPSSAPPAPTGAEEAPKRRPRRAAASTPADAGSPDAAPTVLPAPAPPAAATATSETTTDGGASSDSAASPDAAPRPRRRTTRSTPSAAIDADPGASDSAG